MNRTCLTRLPILLGLALAACGSSAPAATEPGMASTEPAAAEPTANIIQTAVAAGSFKTLVTAVEAAGLVATLEGPGPFTVFAPTDEAFAKLPPGTLEALLADKAKLTAVLTYHVVAGDVSSSAVAGMKSATTVQGSAVAIDASAGVKINDATVIKADIKATNGVIHVIDTVLLPPS